MYRTPRFLGSGDSCLVVEFSDSIDMEANLRLQSLRRELSKTHIPGVLEYVPTYRSLAVYFNPLSISRAELERLIDRTMDSLDPSARGVRRVLVMPVAYGGEFGPDMKNVSEHTGMSEEEIVRRHTGLDYYCYMLGFTPGFSYLGGMDESLATPRLRNPRLLIPAGSVGIAGKQTGAYSIDSPGGWQLIGRTPLRLFDPSDSENPTLIDSGDWIRFRSISSDEYSVIQKEVSSGKYSPVRVTEEVEGLCPSSSKNQAR
ncbi:MAG: 5-oxoprolinase subunit PxpB [Synergistaceae bacterium]|jgi:KipI family sensor histidine kinase inhibitor|nr:5-oxoprolinase subunit PxpB [Synergistaceae bacterium]